MKIESVDGWKEIPIAENNETLVALGPFSKYSDIFTSSIYFGERINSPYPTEELSGSLITMFARESVAERLRSAQSLLPTGLRLVVYDAFRTFDVQKCLFDRYFNELQSHHPNWTVDKLLKETQRYVSIPSVDPKKPSPHNTGGSVDLAIIQLAGVANDQLLEIEDKQSDESLAWQEHYLLEMQKTQLLRVYGRQLDFGTPFDFGGEAANLEYFEKLAKDRLFSKDEAIAAENRRLLYEVMRGVGMEPYTDEWWHFNAPESQMGAKSAGLSKARFGAISLSEVNIEHEQMRQGHYRGIVSLATSSDYRSKLGVAREDLLVVQNVARLTGDWRETVLQPAEILAPVI